MTAQLDLFHVPLATVHARGVGKVIQTEGGGWRARDTGGRFGWVFYRADGDDWETWEPELPHGMSYCLTQDMATQLLTQWVERFGDTPYWRLV